MVGNPGHLGVDHPTNRIITLGMMQNTDYRHSRVVHGTVSNILFRPAGQ